MYAWTLDECVCGHEIRENRSRSAFEVGGAPSAGVTTILISDTSGAERSSQIHPKNQLLKYAVQSFVFYKIYHGSTMIDRLGRGAGNLKSEQLISYLYNNNSEYIEKITPLILYFNKHILSKKEYCDNPYIQSHPYYMISSVLSLHPNYIAEILTGAKPLQMSNKI